VQQDFAVSLEPAQDDLFLLRVSGELDLETASQLSEPLTRASALHRGVVVDLTEVDFLDSTAIAIIVRAWQATNTVRPGRVYLVVEPESQPERVLEICEIPERVPTFANAKDALSALRSATQSPA
jgi:anti-anti-sigma factor